MSARTRPTRNGARQNNRMDEGGAHEVLLFAEKLLILEKCWGKESQFSSSFSFVFWGIMLAEKKTNRNALSYTGSASSQA